MPNTTTVIAAGLLGAATMYVCDPEHGRRRRALIRDRLVRWRHDARDAARGTVEDVRNRARGLVAETRGRLADDGAPDDVIAERVRSVAGQWLSHPGAVTVAVSAGQVTLAGPVLAREVQGFVRAVERVRGVRAVAHQLEVHAHPDVPALQGGRPKRGPLPDLLQRRWSPTTRAVVGVAGLAVFLLASRRVVAAGGSALASAAVLMAARPVDASDRRR